MSPGFKPEELAPRYDVETFSEDQWHEYSGKQTTTIVTKHLERNGNLPPILLNAGSGVYELAIPGWTEIAIDLFEAPIRSRKNAVQGNIEDLKFSDKMFGGVVCVGEVLGYCDPKKAFSEFARIMVPNGIMVCDFGSTRGFRRWFKKEYRRAADIVTEKYNSTPEKIWIYDPFYIESLLVSSGFRVLKKYGTHTWSALARRLGCSVQAALFFERRLEWWRLPTAWADVTTIFAVRA